MAARGAAADTASNANGYGEQHARRTTATLSDVVVVGRQLSLVAVYVVCNSHTTWVENAVSFVMLVEPMEGVSLGRHM